ncbi:MAG: hypothetical protein ACLP5H_21710 [Desulfomonilaceae bacterium]
MNEAQKELKGVMLNVNKDVWGKIKELARDEQRTASGLVRLWLKEGLERHLATIQKSQAA